MKIIQFHSVLRCILWFCFEIFVFCFETNIIFKYKGKSSQSEKKVLVIICRSRTVFPVRLFYLLIKIQQILRNEQFSSRFFWKIFNFYQDILRYFQKTKLTEFRKSNVTRVSFQKLFSFLSSARAKNFMSSDSYLNSSSIFNIFNFYCYCCFKL